MGYAYSCAKMVELVNQRFTFDSGCLFYACSINFQDVKMLWQTIFLSSLSIDSLKYLDIWLQFLTK